MIPLSTHRSSTRGLPRDFGKKGRSRSIYLSASQKCPLIVPPLFGSLNQANRPASSRFMGPDPKHGPALTSATIQGPPEIARRAVMLHLRLPSGLRNIETAPRARHQFETVLLRSGAVSKLDPWRHEELHPSAGASDRAARSRSDAAAAGVGLGSRRIAGELGCNQMTIRRYVASREAMPARRAERPLLYGLEG